MIAHIHESKVGFDYYQLEKSILYQCNHFIAASQNSKDILIKNGIDQAVISIIYPISDHILSIDTNEPKSYTINKHFVVGVVGNGWTKGNDLLPQLAAKMKTLHYDCQILFQLVANFDHLSNLETQYDIDMLGVNDIIQRLPKTSNPIEYFKKFDAFMLLSREESFSLVALENALLGNPLLLFEKTNGIQEFLEDRENAMIVPYLNLDALCDCIYKLYIDETLRRKIGKNGQQLVQSLISRNPHRQVCQVLDKLWTESKR